MHIGLIVLGSIFILLGAFHTNLWFDEAYSVGLANQGFREIWQITGTDVHPPLYYFMLRALMMFSGGSILALRLFSAVPLMAVAILGYTHIRKDFGEKTGILFSFLVLFLPSMATYAGEIRMYSWAMLFVTLTAIYAMRIKEKSSLKNWLIFSIFSIASAYTHYYGLMVIGIINVLLFIDILKNKKDTLKQFLLFGFMQFFLYLPWLLYFVSQLREVSEGFWIGVSFPGTLIEVVNSMYIGEFYGRAAEYIIFGLVIALYIYIASLVKKNKGEEKSRIALQSLALYAIIILAAAVISLVMWTSILYYRYLLVMGGLLILFLAYFMGKEKKTWVTVSICTLILALSIVSNIQGMKRNYSEENQEQLKYLRENLLKDDIIVFYTRQSAGDIFVGRVFGI